MVTQVGYFFFAIDVDDQNRRLFPKRTMIIKLPCKNLWNAIEFLPNLIIPSSECNSWSPNLAYTYISNSWASDLASSSLLLMSKIRIENYLERRTMIINLLCKKKLWNADGFLPNLIMPSQAGSCMWAKRFSESEQLRFSCPRHHQRGQNGQNGGCTALMWQS